MDSAINKKQTVELVNRVNAILANDSESSDEDNWDIFQKIEARTLNVANGTYADYYTIARYVFCCLGCDEMSLD